MRVCRTSGARSFEPWPEYPTSSLGPADHEIRLAGGEQCFEDINLVPSPGRGSPYYQAGILSFVFGHLWQRPGLSRVDRRFVTVPCVGVSDALTPIHSHVGSALGSGDISLPEMNELILQFAAYSGFAKAEVLNQVAAEEWARLQSQKA